MQFFLYTQSNLPTFCSINRSVQQKQSDNPVTLQDCRFLGSILFFSHFGSHHRNAVIPLFSPKNDLSNVF